MEQMISIASAVAGNLALGALKAICAAAGTTHVKTTPGLLKGLWITGTGTAGTVQVLDNSVGQITLNVPAAAVSYFAPLPPEGVQFATNIDVITSGAGVTALAIYV